MRAFVISLSKIYSSANSGKKVVNDLIKFGINASLFEGTYGNDAVDIFKKEGRELQPISFKGNAIDDNYRRSCERPGVMGCFHSHYRLWQLCAELNESIMIFEDDVIFERGFVPIEWDDILLLATGKAAYENDFYKEKLYSPQGEPMACKFKGKVMPGAVGYAITPKAASKLCKHYQHYYLPADNALNMSVVNLQCHSHLMGRAAVDTDGKKSLTKTGMWAKMPKKSANTPQS